MKKGAFYSPLYSLSASKHGQAFAGFKSWCPTISARGKIRFNSRSIQSSFITDADRMAVVIEAMRTYFFQRAAAVYFAVAGQIEMIADVTEAAVVDVVAAAILKAQGHALRRG